MFSIMFTAIGLARFVDVHHMQWSIHIPVVPHKAVAEVSKIFKNRKPRGEVGCCESRMAVFSGVVAMVAVVTSSQLLDVVWCSAVVVVL